MPRRALAVVFFVTGAAFGTWAARTVGYLGSVVGPPGIGALAAPLGLRAALASLALCAFAVAVLAARADDP